MPERSQYDRPRRRRFQFSLRLLLIVTAVVAVSFAVYMSGHRQRVAVLRPMQFSQAIRNGDLAEVDRLLKVDPKLAHGLEHNGTSSSHPPLQRALGNPRIVDRILQENPDINETSADGDTALHVAVARRLHSEVKRFIQLGADVNAIDHRGNTPLLVAMNNIDSDGQLTKLLLDGGADPNLVSTEHPDARSPLHLAVESRNQVVVEHLLAAGAHVNGRDTSGQTVLHLSAARDQSTVASLLIEHGADLTAKDRHGLIPGQRSDGTNSETAAEFWWKLIDQSLQKGEVAALDKMLDAAPQALSFRTEHLTMFGRALYNRRLDVLDYLLRRQADPEVRRMVANRYLHWACADSSADFAKRLFDAGADIQARSEIGQTPLHAAARGHNREVLRLLIAKGAKIEVRDNAGATPIDAAFERRFHDDRETLEILRQAGHPPTVLYAAATGDLDQLRKLTGADPASLDRAYTRNGIRPLHAAVLGNQPRIIQWLFEQGVEREPPFRYDQIPSHNETPLMRALGQGLTDVAILLIKHGTDVNRKSSRGHYPVHAVVEWDRDPRILEALLAHGADPMLKYRNQTAVEFAKASKSEQRKRYLELFDAAVGK
jgi:ankyrin repeat protein